MTTLSSTDPRIESYLAQVRAALRGLPEREMDDILRELRSHITELAGEEGAGIDAGLRSLGDPVDLAMTYRAESRMVQAECSRSPLVILQGLRHASRGRSGRFIATALYFFGYANVLALWSAAIEKLFGPARTGLWYIPGKIWSLSLITDGRPVNGARELLGWWLVPVFLAVGWVLRDVIDRIAQGWIRRYRRSITLQTP